MTISSSIDYKLLKTPIYDEPYNVRYYVLFSMPNLKIDDYKSTTSPAFNYLPNQLMVLT